MNGIVCSSREEQYGSEATGEVEWRREALGEEKMRGAHGVQDYGSEATGDEFWRREAQGEEYGSGATVEMREAHGEEEYGSEATEEEKKHKEVQREMSSGGDSRGEKRAEEARGDNGHWCTGSVRRRRKDTGEGGSERRREKKCTVCGGVGHVEQECRKARKERKVEDHFCARRGM